MVYEHPVAVIVSVTLTVAGPEIPFHMIMTLLLVDGPDIVPFVTDQLYVLPPITGFSSYNRVSPRHGLVSPVITGAGRGFTVISRVAVAGVPHPKVAVLL